MAIPSFYSDAPGAFAQTFGDSENFIGKLLTATEV